MSVETLRKVYESLNEAKNALKRRKERYDKKKRQLEACDIRFSLNGVDD